MKIFTQLNAKLFKLLIGISSLVYSGILNAQNILPNKAIQVVGGYSRHGSGDMNGIAFGTEYIKYISNRFSLNYNIRASINDGKTLIIVDNPAASARTDASVRFTTAGVQLGVNGGLSIVRSRRHEVMISLGGFGRYQSASNGSDGYAMFYPLSTGQPTVLIGYNNRTPQETFSVGGLLQVQYNFTIKNKIYLGILPGFQTDTNGDAIPQLVLAVGRRL